MMWNYHNAKFSVVIVSQSTKGSCFRHVCRMVWTKKINTHEKGPSTTKEKTKFSFARVPLTLEGVRSEMGWLFPDLAGILRSGGPATTIKKGGICIQIRVKRGVFLVTRSFGWTKIHDSQTFVFW